MFAQIGLVDLLMSVGIEPDNMIGHSVGELGCASIETKMIQGSMAAIGLGYEEIKNICPPDIEVACHNGPDSCTISGPIQSMKEFVAKLQVRFPSSSFLKLSN